jgi:hypothetical protein
MKSSMLIMAIFLIMAFAGSSAHTGELSAGTLLPGEKDLEGWKLDGEALFYTSGNLWEYINGQAETFLMYDFREVAAQHYLDSSDLEIKVEIYEHGDPLMTFGIYSQFRSPEGAYLDFGNEAFGDEYSIHFWKGRFYVTVSAYDEGEKSGEAMKMFAGIVAAGIPEEGGEPKETGLFPGSGLVEKSITYVTEGVMGSGKFPPAFTGDYMSGEEKGKLYLFPLESEAGAAELFAWYTGELEAKAGEAMSGKMKYAVAEGEAPYRGPVKVFRFGRFMGIVTGFGAGSKTAVSIADETVALVGEFCGKK